MAWGLKKSVIIAPLLPWPFRVFVVPEPSEQTHKAARLKTAAAIHKQARFIHHATRRLRPLALAAGLLYYSLLPIQYTFFYHEPRILALIAIANVFTISISVHFFVLHKRLFPSDVADRLKLTLYTAFLPWYVVRCPDEFFIKSSRA